MIKQIISGILSRYDYAIMDAKVRLQLREDNLAAFSNLLREYIFTVVADFAAADKRVTLTESNGGVWVELEGKPLFRASVSKYSDRVEAVIDGERYLRYDGINPYWIENFSPSMKILVMIKDRLIQAFVENAQTHLEKKIAQL